MTRCLIGLLTLASVSINAAGAGIVPALRVPSPEVGSHDHFGLAVDIDRDQLIVGDFGANQAHVYDVATGQLVRTLNAPAGAASFGKDVAISDQWIVVGAFGNRLGSAHLYDRSTGLLRHTFRSSLPDTGSDWFGHAVDVDGDTVTVGAPLQNANGDLDTGAVFVFDAVSGSEVDRLLPSRTGGNPRMGWSVALQGGTLITGAIGDDGFGDGAGAAYLFEQADNEWQEAGSFACGSSARSCGFDVSIDGDSAAIATSISGSSRTNLTGVTRVLRRRDGNWRSGQALSNSIVGSDVDDDLFGVSLAMDDGLLAIGRFTHEEAGQTVGSVSVYNQSESGFYRETDSLVGEPSANGLLLGAALGIDDGTLVVGLNDGLNARPAGQDGAVWVYRIPEPSALLLTLSTVVAAGGCSGRFTNEE